jgi:hypothetical protein
MMFMTVMVGGFFDRLESCGWALVDVRLILVLTRWGEYGSGSWYILH